MKKYIPFVVSMLCISCADLDSQMGVKKGDPNQSSSTVSSNKTNNSSKKTTQNTPAPKPSNVNANSANKKNSDGQTSTKGSNSDLASQPDWVSKMKQDMENSKSPKQKESEANSNTRKQLIAESDFVYRCSPPYSLPVEIYVTKNGVIFKDVYFKDVSANYQNIQKNGALVYFDTRTHDTGAVKLKYKYALDTTNGKLAQLSDTTSYITGQQSKNAEEVSCKKLK